MKKLHELAGDIAETILDHSYRDSYGGVQDVVLFGSTLHTDNPRDIDMLLLHNSYALKDFGVATVYNEETHRAGIDENAKVEALEPQFILDALGHRVHEDVTEYSFFIHTEIMEFHRKLACSDGREIVINNKRWTPQSVLDHMKDLTSLIEKVEKESVLRRVQSIMEENRRSMKHLDIQTMQTELLTKEGEEGRRLAIKQSKDSAFWFDVLSEGRIFDSETRAFEIPVNDKYPNATGLFRP